MSFPCHTPFGEVTNNTISFPCHTPFGEVTNNTISQSNPIWGSHQQHSAAACTYMSSKTETTRILKWKKLQKENNTRDSNVVPHRSTNRARTCLTSQSGRDVVLSCWYGRSQHTIRLIITYILIVTCWDRTHGYESHKSQVTSHSTSFVFDKMPTCLRTASDTRIFNVINTEIAREEQVEHGKGKSWRPGSSCMTNSLLASKCQQHNAPLSTAQSQVQCFHWTLQDLSQTTEVFGELCFAF